MESYRIAVLWRGDRDARKAATPQNNRYYRIFEELGALGIHAEPAVYGEEFVDEVREQLLAVDGVLAGKSWRQHRPNKQVHRCQSSVSRRRAVRCRRIDRA
jgi:hypothetical protein